MALQSFRNQWNANGCSCYNSNCNVYIIKFLNKVSSDSKSLISSPGGVILTFQWTAFTTPTPAVKLSISIFIKFRRAEILEKFSMNGILILLFYLITTSLQSLPFKQYGSPAAVMFTVAIYKGKHTDFINLRCNFCSTVIVMSVGSTENIMINLSSY